MKPEFVQVKQGKQIEFSEIFRAKNVSRPYSMARKRIRTLVSNGRKRQAYCSVPLRTVGTQTKFVGQLPALITGTSGFIYDSQSVYFDTGADVNQDTQTTLTLVESDARAASIEDVKSQLLAGVKPVVQRPGRLLSVGNVPNDVEYPPLQNNEQILPILEIIEQSHSGVDGTDAIALVTEDDPQTPSGNDNISGGPTLPPKPNPRAKRRKPPTSNGTPEPNGSQPSHNGSSPRSSGGSRRKRRRKRGRWSGSGSSRSSRSECSTFEDPSRALLGQWREPNLTLRPTHKNSDSPIVTAVIRMMAEWFEANLEGKAFMWARDDTSCQVITSFDHALVSMPRLTEAFPITPLRQSIVYTGQHEFDVRDPVQVNLRVRTQILTSKRLVVFTIDRHISDNILVEQPINWDSVIPLDEPLMPKPSASFEEVVTAACADLNRKDFSFLGRMRWGEELRADAWSRFLLRGGDPTKEREFQKFFHQWLVSALRARSYREGHTREIVRYVAEKGEFNSYLRYLIWRKETRLGMLVSIMENVLYLVLVKPMMYIMFAILYSIWIVYYMVTKLHKLMKGIAKATTEVCFLALKMSFLLILLYVVYLAVRKTPSTHIARASFSPRLSHGLPEFVHQPECPIHHSHVMSTWEIFQELILLASRITELLMNLVRTGGAALYQLEMSRYMRRYLPQTLMNWLGGLNLSRLLKSQIRFLLNSMLFYLD